MIIRLTIIAYLLTGITDGFSQSKENTYLCNPCELSCDILIFHQPGKCPHCGMQLISKVELHKYDDLVVNEIKIENGSGQYLIEGGKGYQDKVIRVYYHRPQNFTPDSPILLVIPGSGRDADEYRDSWIKASEKYGLLILSPKYAEQEYNFGAYHLGGVLHSMNLKSCITRKENSNIVELDEPNFRYEINSNEEEWIFNDFDRLFDGAVAAIGSSQTMYDIFGHSAGGQILHRMVLFHPHSKANRILASNSGFYTMPDHKSEMPFGLEQTPVNVQELKSSFGNKLVLFLGELDNENESGGLLLRSPTVDKQGLHRLARGKYFYKEGKLKAERMNTPFNWKLEVIPNTGHDFRKMGAAAAEYLYGDDK